MENGNVFYVYGRVSFLIKTINFKRYFCGNLAIPFGSEEFLFSVSAISFLMAYMGCDVWQ